MTFDIIIVLAVLIAAAILFAVNIIRNDLVGMIVLLVLLLTGVLTTEEAFAGFSSSTVFIVASMFIIGEAIVYSGIALGLGNTILRYGGTDELRIMILLMGIAALIGSFMSSTATTAIFIPIALLVAEKANLNHRRLLMPLSIAALVSGMMTLIATTPNLIINDVLSQRGLDGFLFFSFTPFGVCTLVLAILFMAFIGRRILSRDKGPSQKQFRPTIDQLIEKYGLESKSHRVHVDSDSLLLDKSLARIKLLEKYGLLLIVIERQVGWERTIILPSPSTVFEEEDTLFLIGSEEMCLAFINDYNLSLVSTELDEEIIKLIYQSMGVVEVMITPDSVFIGKTLKELKFQQRFNGLVMGVRRQGVAVLEDIPSLPLMVGDTMLVSSDWQGVYKFEDYRKDLLVFTLPAESKDYTPGKTMTPIVIGAIVSMVVLIIAGILPPVTASVAAAVLLVLTGCIPVKRLYDVINWQTIILIATILPLATALTKTGAADLLSDLLIANLGGLKPILMLTFIFLVTSFLGLFISSTATVVLIAPVAIDVAVALGVSPYSFAMTVAIASSAAYVTPMSSPSNLMVQVPGGYSFLDFIKVGLPIQFLTLVCTVMLAWFFYL